MRSRVGCFSRSLCTPTALASSFAAGARLGTGAFAAFGELRARPLAARLAFAFRALAFALTTTLGTSLRALRGESRASWGEGAACVVAKSLHVGLSGALEHMLSAALPVIGQTHIAAHLVVLVPRNVGAE